MCNVAAPWREWKATQFSKAVALNDSTAQPYVAAREFTLFGGMIPFLLFPPSILPTPIGIFRPYHTKINTTRNK